MVSINVVVLAGTLASNPEMAFEDRAILRVTVPDLSESVLPLIVVAENGGPDRARYAYEVASGLSKGDPVMIRGHLRRSFRDDRAVVEVVAREVKRLADEGGEAVKAE